MDRTAPPPKLSFKGEQPMARTDFRFARGAYVKDLVTGLCGVVISRMDSITGCDRYCVQPPCDPKNTEGKMPDAVWFDDQCLEYDPQNAGKKLDLQMRQGTPPG